MVVDPLLRLRIEPLGVPGMLRLRGGGVNRY